VLLAGNQLFPLLGPAASGLTYALRDFGVGEAGMVRPLTPSCGG